MAGNGWQTIAMWIYQYFTEKSKNHIVWLFKSSEVGRITSRQTILVQGFFFSKNKIKFYAYAIS